MRTEEFVLIGESPEARGARLAKETHRKHTTSREAETVRRAWDRAMRFTIVFVSLVAWSLYLYLMYTGRTAGDLARERMAARIKK